MFHPLRGGGGQPAGLRGQTLRGRHVGWLRRAALSGRAAQQRTRFPGDFRMGRRFDRLAALRHSAPLDGVGVFAQGPSRSGHKALMGIPPAGVAHRFRME